MMDGRHGFGRAMRKKATNRNLCNLNKVGPSAKDDRQLLALLRRKRLVRFSAQEPTFV